MHWLMYASNTQGLMYASNTQSVLPCLLLLLHQLATANLGLAPVDVS